MPDAITNLTQGLPVELNRIDRELKRLWQEGEGAATRASLINFAVYCEGEEMMAQTTALIAQLTRDHACRAILIGLDPHIPGAGVQAWITAHCHLSRAGAKQVCCEQITFQLGCEGRSLIPNMVFSHLDSDLPLALWWRGDFPAEPEEQLWTWVDRLFFDSQTWAEPGRQFDLLRTVIEPASPRMALCDLNWTRSLFLRQAVAQIFDSPVNLAALKQLEAVEITHAPGASSTALLLAGWLAAQLQWTFIEGDSPAIHFHDRAGAGITVTFREAPGPTLGGIRLSAPSASFLMARREGSSFLHADIHLPDRDLHYLLPGGKDDLVSLLNDDLMAGGRHRVYLKAATAIAAAL